LLKIDTTGNLLFAHEYQLGAQNQNSAPVARQTADGGYVLCTTANPPGPYLNDVYLMKADQNGDSIWSKSYGTNGTESESSIRETRDGGFVIAGYRVTSATAKALIVRTDENGDTLWTRVLGGLNSQYANDVQETTGGGFVLAGNSGGNGYPLYIAKTDPNGLIDEVRDDRWASQPSHVTLSQNYPNPFNPTTTIIYDLANASHVRLSIFNVLGQEVLRIVDEEEHAGLHRAIVDGTRLASGVYIYRLTGGMYPMVKNMILMR
jgi:hypothetical protein